MTSYDSAALYSISPFSSIVLKEKAEARKEERREKTGSEIVGGYDPDASFADILNAYEKTGNPYALKKAKAVEEPTDFASIFEKWENRGKKKEVTPILPNVFAIVFAGWGFVWYDLRLVYIICII